MPFPVFSVIFSCYSTLLWYFSTWTSFILPAILFFSWSLFPLFLEALSIFFHCLLIHRILSYISATIPTMYQEEETSPIEDITFVTLSLYSLLNNFFHEKYIGWFASLMIQERYIIAQLWHGTWAVHLL